LRRSDVPKIKQALRRCLRRGARGQLSLMRPAFLGLSPPRHNLGDADTGNNLITPVQAVKPNSSSWRSRASPY